MADSVQLESSLGFFFRESKKPSMSDGELMALVSEMVLGYCEGSAPDIIQGIAKLKVSHYKLNEIKGVHELYDKCIELGELAEEIRAHGSDN